MRTSRVDPRPERARAAGSAPPLTETQVQRRGPVGRLFTAHPRIADVFLVASVLLLGAATALLVALTIDGATGLGMYLPDAPTAWLSPAGTLAGALLGATLLTARRAWPLAITVALTLLAVVSLVTVGVLGVLGVCLASALHNVALRHSARTTWLTCAAVFVVVLAAIWWWQDIGLAEILLWSDPIVIPDGDPGRQLTEPPFSPGRRSASMSLLLALLLLGVATGSAARARRAHAQGLVERYEAMARDRDNSAALARASERARIAREMHDVVAHSVSVMVALSDGAGAALDRAPASSREALRELSNTGRTALSDMQRVLGALDPDDADVSDDRPAPVETDLATAVERFRVAGLPVTATGLDSPLPEDTSVRLAVVRIVTESLTNVLRHAPGASSVRVSVRPSGSAVEVEVLDSGGTRPGTGGGTGRGIVGIRERAALLGGRADVGPLPDGGWRVHVLLPLDRADQAITR
ncbi:sensor histidine kinase [Occultella gossypii]|uniref:histidine kinase n=1 Tax=Occultella gossypii TaxID=2800820 RepID=A0ABS7SF21_9MICO|nr:histidine kinase [Occultella gossypii]MBZ2197891.1 two-component sensor histidine kinase [Occultella gossypii]